MKLPTTEQPGEEDHWKALWGRIRSMTIDPIEHPPFVFNAILAMSFAGLGIWTEIIRLILKGESIDLSGLLTAVLTFFPALAGSASIQLVVAATGKKDKSITALGILLMTASSMLAVVLAIFSERYPYAVLIFGALAAFFSVWVWWIANGEDPNFKVTPVDPESFTGGDLDRPMSGDLGGINA